MCSATNAIYKSKVSQCKKQCFTTWVALYKFISLNSHHFKYALLSLHKNSCGQRCFSPNKIYHDKKKVQKICDEPKINKYLNKYTHK